MQTKYRPTIDFKKHIREIADFPKKGVDFKDITPILEDKELFSAAIDQIVSKFREDNITHIVSVEARGFLLGSAVAYALGCGLVPVRKKGKLPSKTYQIQYDLEYGVDTLEIHKDGLKTGGRVLIVDDVLATGGTLAAVLALLKNFELDVIGTVFLVELSGLKGRDKLGPSPVFSLVRY